eukprot:TRINITY_DN5664_c0_g1_i2.p1 TRINITY_DN5664_c0_g1~~TRINITY_DN5664_c0_g1_i2.p1  ORF type:complete len:116 (-),score=12.68 TRINITY_DN5664_c0_g1_i2:26-373(-)
MVTRKSVNRAFNDGITAEQIISYLEMNIHSSVVNEPRPKTVYDQIRYWYKERERIIPAAGSLVRLPDKVRDMPLIIRYAQTNGILLWTDNQSKVVVRSDSTTLFVQYVQKVLDRK